MTVTTYPPAGIVGQQSSGGGTSDASAANQLTEIDRLTSIRDAVALKAATGMVPFQVNTATAGDLLVAAAVPGQTHRVHRLLLTAAGPVTLTLKSGATVLRTMVMQSAGNFTLDYSLVPWAVTGVNTALNLGLSAPVQVTGDIETVTGA